MTKSTLDDLAAAIRAGGPIETGLVGALWADTFDVEAPGEAERDPGPAIDLARFARPVIGERVLDLGCGIGWSARSCAADVGGAGDVLGLDVSPAMIAAARDEQNPPNCTFDVGDAATTELEPSSFDLVISSFSLYYAGDLRAVLDRIHRWLAPHGRLVLSTMTGGALTPAAAELRRAAPAGTIDGFGLLDADELADELAVAGFAIERTAGDGTEAAADGFPPSAVASLSRVAEAAGLTPIDQFWLSPPTVTFVSADRQPSP